MDNKFISHFKELSLQRKSLVNSAREDYYSLEGDLEVLIRYLKSREGVVKVECVDVDQDSSKWTLIAMALEICCKIYGH